MGEFLHLAKQGVLPKMDIGRVILEERDLPRYRIFGISRKFFVLCSDLFATVKP